MNSNYNRGRRAEYRAIKDLEAAGYIATRSAGSHGIWDIVAINKNGVRLIQVKSDNDECDVKFDCRVALEQMQKLHCPDNVTCEVWGRVHGQKGWLVQDVAGRGESE